LGAAGLRHVRGRGEIVGQVRRSCRSVLSAGWPGFEVGWGIAKEFRGKGYAVEAARATIDWSFATFELEKILHCIDRENVSSQAVARRLGATIEGETVLLGHPSDIWVTYRSKWMG